MPNRLEPLDLADYTGGLNLRRNPLALGENESPDMLNVDVDPRGGFATRKGWLRWNEDDITDVSIGAFNPRNHYSHAKSNYDQDVYVVEETNIHVAASDAIFSLVVDGLGNPLVAQANVHGADFAGWGDVVYIVTGPDHAAVRRQNNVVQTLGEPDVGSPTATWSEIDAPVFGNMPKADFIEPHAGYMFVAAVHEDGEYKTTRLRWSHPGVPDAWRESDYIDLEANGGRITGIMAFQDHLLIFKTNNIWALYGYDDDSWQLVRVSTSTGCPCTTAASRSETMAFFYSSSDKGGIYAYNGSAPMYISERLRPAFEDVFAYDKVFVSWAGRRLWVGVPWVKDVGATSEVGSCFVFDPDTGDNGSWTMYRSDIAAIATVIDASDINGKYPLAALASPDTACVVLLDRIADAYDSILIPSVIAITPGDGVLTATPGDLEIEVTGPLVNAQTFQAYYRTRWLHAGWPDRKKSWRRPTFICREVAADTELLVESYRDYDETTIRRSRRLRVPAQGTAYWTEEGYESDGGDGFDWTPDGAADVTGADWAAAKKGSKMIRGGSLGLARAVQMKVSASPNTPRQRWGVDAIVAKIVMRRFR